MAVVFKYENGALRLRDGSQVYFEVGLDGKFRKYKTWDTFYLKDSSYEAFEFMVDFLKGRELLKVEFGDKIKAKRIFPYRYYKILLTYSDCLVYIDYNVDRYEEVLFWHKNFYMTFHVGIFSLIVRDKDGYHYVEDVEMNSERFLERLISEFSDKLLDIKAKGKFKLDGDSLKVYVNGHWLFTIGLDRLEYSGAKIIYLDVSSMDEADDLYVFLLRLYNANKDKMRYFVDGPDYVFVADDFGIRCGFKYGNLSLSRGYSHSDFEDFYVGFNYIEGAYIEAVLKNGGLFEYNFEGSPKLFSELISNELKRYVKAMEF